MRTSIIAVLSTLTLLLHLSCSTKGEESGRSGALASPTPTPTPTVDPQNPPVSKVSDVAGFFVAVDGTNAAQFNIHKGLSTFDEKCTATAGEQVDCYVEAEEQTFFAQDLTLHYHLPSTMCDYVSVSPFYFVNRQTKLQNSALHVYTDGGGNIGIDNNNDGTLDSTDFGCFVRDRQPICCVGRYQQINHVWNTSSSTYSITSSDVDRKIDVCLGGPATLTQPKTIFGMPATTFTWIQGTGISEKYEIKKAWATEVDNPWNVNFFAAADHSGGMPAAFQYDINSAVPTTPLVVGNPYYTFSCHNRAWETISQIRIQLRDWNTKAAYDARKTSPTNHDETGFESTPFGTLPINDRRDWKDIEDLSVTFPGYDPKI